MKVLHYSLIHVAPQGHSMAQLYCSLYCAVRVKLSLIQLEIVWCKGKRVGPLHPNS